MTDEELNKAAEEYLQQVKATFLRTMEHPTAKECFLAGAKWMETHTPLPEDTVLFNKGVEEGKRLMMEEAVEGEVMLNPYPTICLDDCKDYDFKDGDKVRIIILKEDEK